MAKTDWAKYNTYKDLNEIEDKITFIFKQAEDELQDSADKAWDVYYNIDAELANKYNSGSITYSEYQAGLKVAAVKGEKIDSLIGKISIDLAGAYSTAWEYVNSKTPEIYALNYNYTAYTIEGLSDSIDFNLWDEATVRRLVVKEPKLLPNYSKAKSLKINMAKTQRAVRNAVLSGILQGKSVDKIASDIQSKITTMSKNSAIRAARTAVTSAQNAGRLDAMWAAKDMGIDVQKQWVATLDSVTRPTHGMLDGSHVALGKKFSNGCSYPGDPSGPSEEVYNCRCTLISYIPGVTDQDDVERWSKDSSGTKSYVTNTTYSQWAAQKLSSNKTVAAKNTLASKKTTSTVTTASKKVASAAKTAVNTAVSAAKTAANTAVTKLQNIKYLSSGRECNDYFYNQQEYQAWKNALTRQEIKDIRAYSNSDYTTLNNVLREHKLYMYSDSEKQWAYEYAARMDTALSGYTLTDNVEVRRGMYKGQLTTMLEAAGESGDFSDLPSLAGKSLLDKGFGSYTPVMGSASGMTDSKDVMLYVSIPAGEGRGAYINALSIYEDSEYEWLFSRNANFVITEAYRESGKIVVKAVMT